MNPPSAGHRRKAQPNPADRQDSASGHQVGDRATLARRMRTQARACRSLGSDLYSAMMERAADELESGDVLMSVLHHHAQDPGDSALALRLFGATHRLALCGLAPRLAAHYPSTGGDGSLEGAWQAFLETVRTHADLVERALTNPPQTNEVGRSAALLAGYFEIASRTSRPLRILEVGASAGLNLRFDQFRYQFGDVEWGNPASGVIFPPSWFVRKGMVLPRSPLAIAERSGCDMSPIDPTDPEGRLTLRSYLWPDQTERRLRLDAALDVALTVPAPVEMAHAPDWLDRMLGRRHEGVVTVVVHSIFIQYLRPQERSRMARVIINAGARADAQAPLAWLALEPGGRQALVKLTLWPGIGTSRVVATAGFHGPPVDIAGISSPG
ncbi:MAG: DUF2332 domain-containing protein [Acidimicrobiales bacterium]